MGKPAVQLDAEMIRVISQTAIEEYKKEAEVQKKQQHDRRLRNVKLLLKNYKSFVKHVGKVEQQLKSIDQRVLLDAIDTGELIVPTIKTSKERTLAMVQFMDRMINVYKIMCEQAGEEEMRRYETIHMLYFGDSKKSIIQIADVHHLAESMVYKDAKRAYEELAVLFFGVESISLD